MYVLYNICVCVYDVHYIVCNVLCMYKRKCSDDLYTMSESSSSSRDVCVDYPVVLSTSVCYHTYHIHCIIYMLNDD